MLLNLLDWFDEDHTGYGSALHARHHMQEEDYKTSGALPKQPMTAICRTPNLLISSQVENGEHTRNAKAAQKDEPCVKANKSFALFHENKSSSHHFLRLMVQIFGDIQMVLENDISSWMPLKEKVIFVEK